MVWIDRDLIEPPKKEFNSAGKKIKKLMIDLEEGKLKEFKTLSDKIQDPNCDAYAYIFVKNIKEFIKGLKERKYRFKFDGKWVVDIEEIDKLAGDDLI